MLIDAVGIIVFLCSSHPSIPVPVPSHCQQNATVWVFAAHKSRCHWSSGQGTDVIVIIDMTL